MLTIYRVNLNHGLLSALPLHTWHGVTVSKHSIRNWRARVETWLSADDIGSKIIKIPIFALTTTEYNLHASVYTVGWWSSRRGRCSGPEEEYHWNRLETQIPRQENSEEGIGDMGLVCSDRVELDCNAVVRNPRFDALTEKARKVMLSWDLVERNDAVVDLVKCLGDVQRWLLFFSLLISLRQRGGKEFEPRLQLWDRKDTNTAGDRLLVPRCEWGNDRLAILDNLRQESDGGYRLISYRLHTELLFPKGREVIVAPLRILGFRYLPSLWVVYTWTARWDQALRTCRCVGAIQNFK